MLAGNCDCGNCSQCCSLPSCEGCSSCGSMNCQCNTPDFVCVTTNNNCLPTMQFGTSTDCIYSTLRASHNSGVAVAHVTDTSCNNIARGAASACGCVGGCLCGAVNTATCGSTGDCAKAEFSSDVNAHASLVKDWSNGFAHIPEAQNGEGIYYSASNAAACCACVVDALAGNCTRGIAYAVGCVAGCLACCGCLASCRDNCGNSQSYQDVSAPKYGQFMK